MALMYLDSLNLSARVSMPHGFGLEVHNVLHPAESRDFLANEPARNKTNILNKSFGIMATELITNDICVRNDHSFNYQNQNLTVHTE